jgi:hypothetical protein
MPGLQELSGESIEQGTGLFSNEDAQQAGAGVRAAEVAGGASDGSEVFRREETLTGPALG